MSCIHNASLSHAGTNTDLHEPSVQTIKFTYSQNPVKSNNVALWSLLRDTANYQYSISILSVRGNRGINFRPLCFPSSLSWSRLCLLTNLLSCFDHKCDYHHTRDNKTPYLCCTKEYELKPKLLPWGIPRRKGEKNTQQEEYFMLRAYSPLLVNSTHYLTKYNTTSSMIFCWIESNRYSSRFRNMSGATGAKSASSCLI